MRTYEDGTLAGDGKIPTDANTSVSKSKKKKKELPKPVLGEPGIMYLWVDWIPEEIVKDTVKAKELNLKIKPDEEKKISKIIGTKEAIMEWLAFYELCGGETDIVCTELYPKLAESFDIMCDTVMNRI